LANFVIHGNFQFSIFNFQKIFNLTCLCQNYGGARQFSNKEMVNVICLDLLFIEELIESY